LDHHRRADFLGLAIDNAKNDSFEDAPLLAAETGER